MNVFELFAKIELDASGFESGLSKAGGAMQGLSSGAVAIGNLISDGVKKAAGAMAGFAKESIQVGMGFDTSMAQVAATMGMTMDQLANEQGKAVVRGKEFTGNLRDYAKFVGQTTEYSASQAADALNYMALAGYKTQDAMTMLPNVLNLASAGQMDMAQASDMVTDAQSALGLTMEQTSTMVDQMAKTASTTNTNVSQLGEAFLQVGGTARDMKGGTAEMSQVLGILADNGMKGAEGGTHLRNILMSLAAPTNKAYEVLDALGISLYDANGEMRSMQDVMLELDGAMANFTSEERTQAISTIFNKYDLKAVNALLGTNKERWDEVSGAISEASYSMDDIKGALESSGVDWAKYSDTAWGAAERAGEGIKGLAEQIIYSTEQGQSFGEIAEFISSEYDMSMADAEKAINAVQKALEESKGAAEAMAETQMDNLAGDLTLFQSALEAVQIELFEGANPALREFVQIGTEGLSQVAAALSEGDIEGAINALGDTIEKLVEKFFEHLPKFMEFGGRILSAIGDGIGGNIELIVSSAVKIIVAIGTALIQNIPLLLDAAKEIVTALGAAIADQFAQDPGGTIAAVALFAAMIGSKLSGGLVPFISKVGEMIGGIGTKAAGMFSSIGSAAGAASAPVSAAGQSMGVLSSNALGLVALGGGILLASTGIALLAQSAIALADAGAPAAVAMGGLVAALAALAIGAAALAPALTVGAVGLVAFGGAITLIGAGIAIAVSGISNMADKLPAIAEYGGAAAEAVGKLIAEAALLPSAVKMLRDAAERAVKDFEEMAQKLSKVMDGVEEGIKDGAGKAKEAAMDVAKAIAEKLRDLERDMRDIGEKYVEQLGEGIKGKKSWVQGEVRDLGRSIAREMQDSVGVHSPSTIFGWIGENIIAGLWDGISGAASTVLEGVKDVGSAIIDTFKGLFGIHSPSAVMAEVGGNLMDGLSDGISDNSSMAEKAARATALSVGLEYEALPEEVREQGAAAIAALAVRMGDSSMAESEAASAASRVAGEFKGLSSELSGAGGNMMEGLWGGISRAAGWVLDNARSLAGSIADAFRDVLGIHSPSTVFAGIGKNLALGLAEGWEGSIGAVSREMEAGIDFSAARTSVAPPARQGGADGGQGGFVQTVNIYSPRELSPSEAARQTRNATRQMLLQMRTA